MPPPNILLITADDMNWDAVGVFGCPDEATTPHLDQLAADGIRFDHAHVTIAVCWPSRSAMMTGRYPHRSGGEGFHPLRQDNVPILPSLLRDGGYRVGILGKLEHSTPYAEFQWDMALDREDLGQGRNPEIYRQRAADFVSQSKASGQPFFLMLNSHDPHRPFYGNDESAWYDDRESPAAKPSKTFTPDEVTTPDFLTDLPEVRLEVSEYYSSVRRCDDTVGETLAMLREQGLENNTLVIFLSDNGMAFPFAKTNCYLHSTRTPWIMRWPGVIQSGTVDREHFVTGIDIAPTLLEAAGVAQPDGMDGESFLPVLRGEKQGGRALAFTQFHQTAGQRNYPMRCVQNRRFGYIFNPWSNGQRVFMNESQAGRTFNAMQAAAAQDPELAARVQLFLYRVPEEFYDFQNDPHALVNLIDDPAYADELNALRNELEAWMQRTEDPTLTAFRNRNSAEAREAFMAECGER
ncbi:sulfatase family protein [Cerasicoccus fimbriatus]|uniref:sulfatase family protein n=1 Tax=Cerasicoccus fimbriatus TaxID=3014554 RepID=UPI0022B4E6F2|nr:sulfatase [Cerasicoccus sp. TK19100]